MTARAFAEFEHEQVRVVSDEGRGLLCVVAIHSTVLGPAMGGVRRMSYESLDDAVEDALRLSRAMTLKNSAAGLPLGGGKSVVVDGAAEFRADAVNAFAEVVEGLNGSYVAAEDIGTTPGDMDRMAAITRWVAGCSPSNGGSGDPSPSTARTVLGAIEQALRVVHGSVDVAGRRIGVVGAGKVGGRLVESLITRGAEVVVADRDRARVAVLAELPGVRVADVEEVAAAELDVLAPCARGGFIARETLTKLRTRIVCGAANNILASDDVAFALHDAGILYVPDFVANAGGIIQVGGEFLGWTQDEIESALAEAVERVGSILDEAVVENETPQSVALRWTATRLSDAEVAIGPG